MNDLEIIELYFERDERAIKETDAKYGRLCHSIANNILHNEQYSEECVNDTYHKTWISIPPTRPRHLGAYVGKITRNLAIDRYNAKTAKKRGGYGFEESLDELSECIGDNCSDDISLKDLGSLISNFLRTEKPLLRKIFIRRYFHGENLNDIALTFGLGLSYVKTSLFRTRQKLRIYLQKEGIYV